jgi:hypothetical protein
MTALPVLDAFASKEPARFPKDIGPLIVVSVETVDVDDERRAKRYEIVHIGAEAGDRLTSA